LYNDFYTHTHSTEEIQNKTKVEESEDSCNLKKKKESLILPKAES